MMNPGKSADRRLRVFSVVPLGFQVRTVRHTFQTCQPRSLSPTLPDFSSVDQFPHFRLHVRRLHDRCPNEKRFCPGVSQSHNISCIFYAALGHDWAVNMTVHCEDSFSCCQIQLEVGKISVVNPVQVWLVFEEFPELLWAIGLQKNLDSYSVR